MGARTLSLTRFALTVVTLFGIQAIGGVTAPATSSFGVAHAASPMIELVSGGDVVGDGLTPVKLHVVAYNSNGTPMNGSTLRITVQAGSVSKTQLVRPGLYSADWTPPRVDAVADVQIMVKGRAEDRTTIDQRWAVTARPTLGQQVAVTVNPSRLTLGQDGGATLNITLSGGPQQPLDDVELIVEATSGTVENVTHLGGGQFAASYRPPNKFFPHLAIITIADKRDPTRTYGSVSIALIGKANFPVVGQPNSNVLVRIDEREFGPVPADAAGRAQIPLEVNPGFATAKIISVVDGRKMEEPLDLQVPPANRVAMFPMPKSVPADPGIQVPVRALVLKPNGEPDASARVKFTTTAGAMGVTEHEGNGIYRAVFTPPFGNSRTQATLQVEVDDLRGRQVSALTVNLIAARPGSVTVTMEPPSLSAGARGFQVLAKVQGSDGVGMPGRTLLFTTNGAKQSGDVRDLGSGDYQARFSTTGKGAVEIITTAKGDASDNHLRRVLLFPSRDRLPNDGLSSAMITVLTLDEFGYPVSNVPVTLKVVSGEGTLPAQATTDGAGLAQVHFTAGRKAGMASVSASARGHTAVIPLLLAPGKIATDYALPASGSKRSIDLYNAWKRIIRSSRLERDGMEGAPIAGYSASAAVGPATTLTATAEPAQVAPGGTVTIRVSAKDADGRGVGGQQLQVLASPGQVSAVTDQGGGNYQVTLTVPAGISGTVKVSVVAPTAGIASTLDVPITGGSWRSVGVADQSTEKEEPAAEEEEPKKQREPRERGDYPILRVGLGLAIGSYSYRQEATVQKGPLYDYDITFGGSVTPPATAPGAALHGRLWIPGVDFVGVSAAFRSVMYQVALPEFQTPIADWLTQFRVAGVARYPYVVGETKLYAGARVGFATDDFMIYRQSGNEEVRVLDYGPLVIPGLIVGPEIGVEWTGGAYGIASLDFGLAYATTYYSLAGDLEVGYAFLPDWYAFGGMNMARRSTGVWMVPDGADEKQQVGILEDHINMFIIGIGYQM